MKLVPGVLLVALKMIALLGSGSQVMATSKPVQVAPPTVTAAQCVSTQVKGPFGVS